MKEQAIIEPMNAGTLPDASGVGFWSSIRRAAKFVYRYAALALVPITVLLVGPETWEIVGLLGAVGLLAVRWIAFESPLPQTRLNLPLLVLLAMVAVSFRFSSAPDLAVPAACKILAGVLIFFVLVDRVYSRADLWSRAGALVLLGTVFAYAAPFTVSWMSEKVFRADFFYDRSWPRLMAPINPNSMAGAIVPIVPIALCLLATSSRRLRILGALALPPLLVILILLQSRGGLMALGAGLVTYFGLASPRWRPVLAVGIIVGVIALAVFPGLLPQSLLDWDNPASASQSLAYRMTLWRLAIPLVVESPLVGTGFAAYPDVAEARFPPLLGEVHFAHAHNLLLQVALDTGIIGALAFLAMMVLAIFGVWQAYQMDIERKLAIGLLAGFAALVVNGLVDMIYWSTKPGIVLWIMLGLAAAFGSVRKLHEQRVRREQRVRQEMSEPQATQRQ